MHVIIIGMGEVGRHLIKTLERDQHDIIAIDSSSDAISWCEESHDVMTIVGYGASMEVLSKAGAAKSDLVVAVTDHDEVNLIAALSAKDMGAKRVIARVQSNDWTKGHQGVNYGHLGIDLMINPQIVLAHELAQIAHSHGALHVIELADHHVELAQVEISEHSRLLNRSLDRLSKTLPSQTLVAAVVRRGELFIPGGSDILLANDRVYIVGLPNQMSAAEDLFTRKREAHTVAIGGGSVVGEALARELAQTDAEVILFEKNHDRAHALSEALPKISVIKGDVTDLDFLQEEGMANVDLFAAAFSDDEQNLLSALLAKKAGATTTAALVQRAGHMEIYRQLGIDIVLSARIVCSEQILRFCRQSAVQNMTVLEDGQAEVIEITAPPSCRAVGVPLSKLRPPRGVLIAAILRAEQVAQRGEEQVLIPSGDSVIERNDRVIIVATRAALPKVHHLFKERAR